MKIAKKVSFTQIGDSTILLDSGKDKTYHELNAAGSIIWKGLVQELAPEQIATKLEAEFEISLEQAKSDVDEFISALVEKRVIEA